MPYTNSEQDYKWFSERAAKAARWLGYVPFERLVDERNAPPEVHVRSWTNPRPACRVVFDDLQVITLEAANLLPSVYCEDLAAEQPYRIILIGEKTSLGPALRRPWGVDEVLLPSGEPSDTMIAGMASRANEDDRPAVVLYFSDFDPGGHQMPVSVSRKLQALRLLKYPDLDIQVHPVALTLEQVVDLDLPSSPLKDTEPRADRWREVMGREQTEIDALCALRPEILDRIVEAALVPFRDTTLRRRAQEARSRAEMEMNRRLRAHPDYQTVCESILEAHGAVIAAIDRLRQCQGEGAEALSALGRTEIEPIEAEIEVDPPEPLFDSEDDYTIATRRLINHKKLNGSEP